MNANPIIELEKIRLSLKGPGGDVAILRDISLRVNSGEKVSIMGPSGSGKTSLLLVLAGLERATSGQVNVAGSNLSALSEDALAAFRREHVGIVFQNFHLVPTMTALENVALPMEFAGRAGAFAEAERMLESVGLAHRIHHLPAQLSGGEQQRVALARAFVMRPSLLLADEPTGNLDQETGKQVVELMLAMQREANTTLLLITHDKTLASQCGRIVSLRDGRVV